MEECREQDKRTGQLSGSSRPERMVRIKAKKKEILDYVVGKAKGISGWLPGALQMK
jgi:hypothetical protein